MRHEKTSLAKALPSEMGAQFFITTTPTERRKLNLHARKLNGPGGGRLVGENDLVSAIWARSVGISLPAALTLKAGDHPAETMVVTDLELQYVPWSFDWHLVLRGLNVRQNGSTGNTDQSIHLPMRWPVSLAKRELSGQWRPSTSQVAEEAVC